MTEIEYDKKLTELSREYNKKVEDFKHEFAMSNKKYNIGDIIKSNVAIIEIDDISVSTYMFTKYPDVHYFGYELTQKLQKRKDGERQGIFQSDVIRKIERS